MKRSREKHEDEKPCQICGDKSHAEKMITCSNCKAQEHDYCSKFTLSKDREALCEECHSKIEVNSTRYNSKGKLSGTQVAGLNTKLNDLPRQATLTSTKRGRPAKVKFLPIGEVLRIESERGKPSIPSFTSSPRPPRINPQVFVPPPRRTSTKSEYFRLRYPVKANRDSCLRNSRPVQTSRDEKRSQHHQQAMQVLVNRRDETCLDQRVAGHSYTELPIEANPLSVANRVSSSLVQERHMDRVSPVRALEGRLHNSKYSPSKHCSPSSKPGQEKSGNVDAVPEPDDLMFESIRGQPHFPSDEASWKGRFILSAKTYETFKAYPPAQAFPKAYEFSGSIDDNFHIELIPESQLLSDPNIFGGKPGFDDVALYIFPDVELDSSFEDYTQLVELMSNQDYAIRGSVSDEVDLLIFTSKHLPVETLWLKADDFFLWGIFHGNSAAPPQNLGPEEICLSAFTPENPNGGLLPITGTRVDEAAGRSDDKPLSCEGPDTKPAIEAEKLAEEWIPPGAGWVKLNTAAISRGDSGLTGIGGTVHGPSGKWITGYVKNLGNCRKLKADLWSLLQGLKLVSERGYRKVQVETDSKRALECLKAAPDDSDPNELFIRACRKLLVADEWEISQSHVSRERNRPAVLMANLFEGHIQLALKTFDSPPPELAETTRNSGQPP